MQIIVALKDVYGETKAYPVCRHAKMLAQIAGTKTLTVQVLWTLQNHGYQIKDALGSDVRLGN